MKNKYSQQRKRKKTKIITKRVEKRNWIKLWKQKKIIILKGQVPTTTGRKKNYVKWIRMEKKNWIKKERNKTNNYDKRKRIKKIHCFKIKNNKNKNVREKKNKKKFGCKKQKLWIKKRYKSLWPLHSVHGNEEKYLIIICWKWPPPQT